MLYIGDQPFGGPRYHPIFEAAARHDLVVGIHHSENSPTALGRHRYFAEWHTLVPQVFMSQAVSLIFNGVFDKYPDLRVILIEGGFTYVPHLMWTRRPAVARAAPRGARGSSARRAGSSASRCASPASRRWRCAPTS